MNCIGDDCDRAAFARGMCRKHYERWRVHGDPNKVLFSQSPAGAPHAFIDDIPETGEGCVLWPYSRNNNGYAQINLGRGQKALVSRTVCERRNGPPPTMAHHAAHSCGNGHLGCIAPWHLSWKTAKENAEDKNAHGTNLRGEQAPWAKLTAGQVAEIRALNGILPHAKIGEAFGVSQTLISRIIRGEAWAA